MSLENLTKKELADKVRELAEKLKEMKVVESQVTASVETLKDGDSSIGIIKNAEGNFTIVKLVFDLEKNAAAIVGTEDLGKDMQIAGGVMMKRIGEVFYKAAGIK
jgi:hypothetical protein